MATIGFRYFPKGNFSIVAGDNIDGNINTDILPHQGHLTLFNFIYRKSELKSIRHDIEIVFLEQVILYKKEYLNEILKDNIPKIIIGTQNILDQESLSTSISLKSLNEFDNNIWLHYVNLTTADKFIKNINEKLTLIAKYYSDGFYGLVVTKEYYNIHKSICKQNYIEGTKGHGSQVLPFIFPSESIFKEKTKANCQLLNTYISEKKYLNYQSDKKIKWHILLADDYANRPLSKDPKSPYPSKKKSEILDSVLNEIKIRCKDIDFDIDYAINIDDIESKLRAKSYDIILLDYLFNGENNKGTSEYGTALLQKLLQFHKELKSGPFNKFWIIPISVFSNAFIDDMRNLGIDFVHESWELSRGGDFINSPWLFLHYFTQFQLQQLNRAVKLVGSQFDDKIKEVLERVETDGIQNSKKLGLKKYQELIIDFKDRVSTENFDAGFLSYISNHLNTLGGDDNIKKIRHFHALLYYLGFKNYVNNEDLIIEHQILRSLLNIQS